MDKVKVIFRKDKEGNIIAFLPELRVNRGNIMSYMHIGQHSEASYQFYTEKILLTNHLQSYLMIWIWMMKKSETKLNYMQLLMKIV